MRSDPRTRAEAGDYQACHVLACAARAFTAEGRIAVVLAVGCDQPRQWTREELWILDEVAARAWPLVERLRSEAVLRRHSEQLRASEERQAFLLELVDAIRPLNDPGEIQAAAAIISTVTIPAATSFRVARSSADIGRYCTSVKSSRR